MYLPGLLRFRCLLRSASEEFGADPTELAVIVTIVSGPPCGSSCRLPLLIPLPCTIPSTCPEVLPHCVYSLNKCTFINNAPYLFLCEALGAFCKFSEPLEGRTERSNILHHFSCDTVPEAKPSSFC